MVDVLREGKGGELVEKEKSMRMSVVEAPKTIRVGDTKSRAGTENSSLRLRQNHRQRLLLHHSGAFTS